MASNSTVSKGIRFPKELADQVLDLSGWFSVSIPDYRNGPQRDREAIAGDWETVGQDLRQSMDHLSSSTTTHR